MRAPAPAAVLAAALAAAPAPLAAQAMDPNMPGMEHGASDHEVLTGDYYAVAHGSGTSRLPGDEGAMAGLHLMPGDDWMVMLHGYVQGAYSSYSGPRGDSEAYVTSMAMASAQRDFGGARLTLNAMMSLEPIMPARGYPNLFATGETADGKPIVDRQHPHDLFMELSARVDVDAGQGALFIYGGPVAEPALGPSAFMHRGSAALNPEPPITHHWFDSTHITYGVVTAGYAARRWQIEASAFRGAEPDERRWNVETPRLDSWSLRATWNPDRHWSAEVSHGFLKSPEATHPRENEHRTVASLHYGGGGFAAMLGFSAKRHTDGRALTAWLAEGSWNIDSANTLFGRIENVANDELFADPASPLHDRAFRVSKFQLGYARRIAIGHFDLALGGAASIFAHPAALDTAYGQTPLGGTLFAKVSLQK